MYKIFIVPSRTKRQIGLLEDTEMVFCGIPD